MNVLAIFLGVATWFAIDSFIIKYFLPAKASTEVKLKQNIVLNVNVALVIVLALTYFTLFA